LFRFAVGFVCVADAVSFPFCRALVFSIDGRTLLSALLYYPLHSAPHHASIPACGIPCTSSYPALYPHPFLRNEMNLFKSLELLRRQHVFRITLQKFIDNPSTFLQGSLQCNFTRAHTSSPKRTKQAISQTLGDYIPATHDERTQDMIRK